MGHSIATLVLLVCIVATVHFCAAQQPATLSIWPHPSGYSYTTGGKTLSINPKTFKFTFASQPKANTDDAKLQKKLLDDAISRYTSLIFQQTSDISLPSDSSLIISEAELSVESYTAKLELGVDESYTISATDSPAALKLTAKTIWGAMYALETLAQMIIYDPVAKTYTISQVPITIQDSPRFKWRGLMIDTSRHYLKLVTIKRIIDTMAYHKLNTMHWHLVDAITFPIEIKSRPLLAEKGAYSPDAIYTQKEIKEIIQYAFTRGIRVIPEIDVPGHTHSWGKGYDNVVSECPLYSALNVNNAALNPLSDTTYEVVSDVYGEMTELFDNPYFHLGGDEIRYGCWKEDEDIRKYMAAQGITDYAVLEAMFWNKMTPIYQAKNRTMICWQELLLNLNQTLYSVPKYNPGSTIPTIVQAWLKTTDLLPIVQQGYHTLLSAGWYLDQQLPNPARTNYLWADTWKNFYQNEPFDPNGDGVDDLTPEQQALVLGGEGCMWGEQVDDSNIDGRIWPRASAIAERLWSPQSVKDLVSAKTRLIHHRCYNLARRGIRAGAIWPDYCPFVYTTAFRGDWELPSDSLLVTSTLYQFLWGSWALLLFTAIVAVGFALYFKKKLNTAYDRML